MHPGEVVLVVPTGETEHVAVVCTSREVRLNERATPIAWCDVRTVGKGAILSAPIQDHGLVWAQRIQEFVDHGA
jgi:hypothetical protein